MTTYKVTKDDDGDFYVRGLRPEFEDAHPVPGKVHPSPDTRLFYDVPYPETETPEVTDPDSTEAMHGALYDLYQCTDALKEGDRFETPFGNFKCVSFHVVRETV